MEEELGDADRCDLRHFVEENCGIGNVDVDAVADIVLGSAIDIDCGQSYTAISLQYHFCLNLPERFSQPGAHCFCPALYRDAIKGGPQVV